MCVCFKVHPSKEFFVVAEKGNQPNIIVYEYPSLQPCRILRGKWDQDALSYMFFRFYVSVFLMIMFFNFHVWRRYRAGIQLCGF